MGEKRLKVELLKGEIQELKELVSCPHQFREEGLSGIKICSVCYMTKRGIDSLKENLIETEKKLSKLEAMEGNTKIDKNDETL